MEFRFPPEPRHLRVLRRKVRRALEREGIVGSPVDRLVLVLDEMVSNAIEHGNSNRAGVHELSVMLRLSDVHVDVEFRDPGVPDSVVRELNDLLRACRGNRPPLDNERGRGLFLIDDGLDELCLEALPGGGLTMRGRMSRVPS
jgi:anti-sigma regulatory factor (Ser/Thr protein kinase)